MLGGRDLSVLGGISEDLLVSTSIGHQIGGETHTALLDSLVKTNVLQDGCRTEQAMRQVDRGNFVLPSVDKADVYQNRPLKIGVVATISTPQQHAQVIGMLEKHLQPGMTALDVGSGSGYLVAVMAHMVGARGNVTGIDIVPELVEFSRDNLERTLPTELLGRVEVIQSGGKRMPITPEKHQYDCIHVGVAVETKQEAESYLDFLKPGGGLLIPLGFANAEQKLVKMTKDSEGNVEKVDVMSVLCQPMLDDVPVAVIRETHAEKLQRLENALKKWREEFEQKYGKKPSRDDLQQDPVAKALFQEYASLRK
ncbi:TPA: hypothetical protein N0F65_002205 [Lagenidium giganteum]|uniref:protein-L-isoaspartate(D-aspartate) O-methyltransferase n=1 Tax=Lagenidium giganteum TaxID=4803 RepID=A0AAV2YMH1_9STRA|nr:TPA: hypothetical protein N0F65_002205 [Lagenidium giganteum]